MLDSAQIHPCRRAVAMVAGLLLGFSLLPAGAQAQTASIPLPTLSEGPTSGTLSNGIDFSVNSGEWHSVSPTNTQGYIIYPANGSTSLPLSPQIWTFDVPVSLRFSLRGLNVSGECLQVPVGTDAEFIHPAHTWDPGTRLVCRSSAGATTESIFTIAGPVTSLQLDAINVPTAGRGPGFIEVTVNAGIDLDKTATGPDPLLADETIDYSFLVTNTGEVDLSNVTVTDPLPGISPISCPGTTLAPGANMTCTASYVVTDTDVDNGSIMNTATVTGDPPESVPQVSAEDSTTMPPVPTPDSPVPVPVPTMSQMMLALLAGLLSVMAIWHLPRNTPKPHA